MSKPGRRNLQTEMFWRKLISAWRDSGLSQKQFSEQQGLNYNTLNAWIRILKARDQEVPVKKERRSKQRQDDAYWWSVLDDWRQSSLNLKLFARGRKLNYRCLLRWKQKLLPELKEADSATTGKTEPTADDFVQVRVVDSSTANVASKSKKQDTSPAIEVVLQSGRLIRVTAECDPAFLRQMVLAMESC